MASSNATDNLDTALDHRYNLLKTQPEILKGNHRKADFRPSLINHQLTIISWAMLGSPALNHHLVHVTLHPPGLDGQVISGKVGRASGMLRLPEEPWDQGWDQGWRSRTNDSNGGA